LQFPRAFWRKSHSLKSIEASEYANKKFVEFLKNNTETDPYKILDNFVTWLDEQGHAPKTIKSCVTWAKEILRQTHEITNEVFRNKVSLPTIQIPMDEKPSEEDLRNLLIHAQGRLKPYIALLKDAPIRPIEAVGLQLMHFNFEHDPPHVIIPAYLSKNDMEREVFFTHETEAILKAYIENRGLRSLEDYVFLLRPHLSDEIGFQKALFSAEKRLGNAFRELLSKPAFKHLKIPMRGRRKDVRYKIHPYSLKKFSFTKAADTLGELAAHAMSGHRAYLITYYKKSREERAKDFKKLIPKLSVLAPTDLEDEKKRAEVQASIQGLSGEQLNAILKLARKLASGKRR